MADMLPCSGFYRYLSKHRLGKFLNKSLDFVRNITMMLMVFYANYRPAYCHREKLAMGCSVHVVVVPPTLVERKYTLAVQFLRRYPVVVIQYLCL